MGRILPLLLGLGAGLGVERAAAACASCGCGDPTLTALGVEQPFAGRLRAGTTFRYRTDELDGVVTREMRWTLAASWAPSRDVAVAAVVPVLWREATYPDETRDTATGLGDIELYARWYIFRDRAFAPRHLVGLTVGAALPTGPIGLDVRDEVLPGKGSLDVLGGASYSYFSGDVFSAHVTALVAVPTWQRGDIDPGVALRAGAAGQAQVTEPLAFRLGADLRAEHEGGALYATGGLLWSPVTDLVLSASLSLPTVRLGDRDDGALVELGLVVDL